MTGPRIAFATQSRLTHADDDRPLLDAAALELGAEASWVAWDDRTADWSKFDAVVIRSTWDYHHRAGEYLAWVDEVSVASQLWNPAPVVRWNHHKGYLLELIRAGAAVVPTALVERGTAVSFEALIDERGWNDVIVKPSVSAGAKSTVRLRNGDAAAGAVLAALVEAGDALVQPYVSEIEEEGETSLVVIDGQLTHAVRKRPAVGDFRVQEQFGGREHVVDPTPSERALAETVIARAREIGELLYARVDCVTVDGDARLMELEVIEPSLYLAHAPPGTAELLVTAVLQRV